MAEFRKATEQDIDRVELLLNTAVEEFRAKKINMWQKGYPNRSNIVSDVASGNAYVALVDGTVMGYMFIHYGTEEFQSTLRGEWRDGNCTVMHRLLTDPAARGMGLGTEMMEYWMKLSREAGYTSIRTETDETNLPMRALMRKCQIDEMGPLTFDNSDKLAFEKVL